MSGSEMLVTYGLAWDFRPSFRQYVRSVARGQEVLRGGAAQLADGRPYFPLEGSAIDEATGVETVRCIGELAFLGHAGVIDVRLRSPQLEIRRNGGELKVDTPEAELLLAGIELLDSYRVEGAGIDTFLYSTSLLPGAEHLFDGVYSAGVELGNIEIRLPTRQ